MGLETIKNQKDSKNEEPNQIATTLKETSINLQKCLLNLNNAFTKTKDCNNLNETKVSINNLFVELQDTYHNKTVSKITIVYLNNLVVFNTYFYLVLAASKRTKTRKLFIQCYS